MAQRVIARTRTRTLLFGVLIFVVITAALWYAVGRHGPSQIPHVGPDGGTSNPNGALAPPSPTQPVH